MHEITWQAACVALLLVVAGCGISDPEMLSLRESFLLEAEPQGATGVLDLRENFSGEPVDVVLVGQIGGVVDPWSPGLASFVIVDPIATIGGEGHGESCDCPFCRKTTDETEGLALVQFLDQDGEILAHDPRRLFGVDKDQVVVVQGRAEMTGLGHIVVAARGMYVRR